jgi:hypothetical protein
MPILSPLDPQIALASLQIAGSVTQDDLNANLLAVGYSDEPASVPFDEILKVNGEVDASAYEALVARSRVVSPLIFTVDGMEIPHWQVLHDRSRLDRTIDGAVTFSFAVARRSSHDREMTEPLGTIDDYCGPPPGAKSIDVDMVVFGSGGPRRIRLVTNGVVIGAPAVVYSSAGEVREFSCADAMGRYVRKTVELVLPPGHGLTREEVVGRVCDELGITDRAISIPNDGPTYKEVQIVDGQGWGFLQQYLESINCAPAFDRMGVFIVRSLAAPDVSASWQFGGQDVLQAGQVTDSPTNDGPTSIVLSSDAQVVHDGSGLRTEVTKVEVFAYYAVGHMPFKQDSSGVITESGITPSPTVFQLVERVCTTRVYEVDTLVFEREQRFNWAFRPTHYRSHFGDEEGDVSYHSAWCDTADGGFFSTSPYEKFLEVARVDFSHTYDDDGFLISTLREDFQIWAVRVALKEWDGSDYVYRGSSGPFGLVPQMFDGDAVHNFETSPPVDPEFPGFNKGQHTLRRVAKEETVYTNDNGYIVREDLYESRYFKRPFETHSIPNYLYNDGTYSFEIAETIQVVKHTITLYTAQGEQASTKTIIENDYRGYTERITREDIDGYLPAAQKKSAIRPDPALYPNGKVASRNEHQEIEVTVSSECLEAHRPNWVDRVSDQYIENEAEAEARARHLLAVSSAVPFQWTLPVNPLLAEAVLVDLLDRQDLHIQRVTIEPGADERGRFALLTHVEAFYYVL